MTKCPSCGKVLTDIKELSEVSSLGLAMRGKCPNCRAWVWVDQLWKKTKYIDKTRPTANRGQSKPIKNRGYSRTPNQAKTSLKMPQASAQEIAIIGEVQNYAE